MAEFCQYGGESKADGTQTCNCLENQNPVCTILDQDGNSTNDDGCVATIAMNCFHYKMPSEFGEPEEVGFICKKGKMVISCSSLGKENCSSSSVGGGNCFACH